MKTILALTALLGLSVTGASACQFQKSVQADNVTVASIAQELTPMTTVDTSLSTGAITTTEAEKPADTAE